jgi:CCR4-NOT complex subunit CAF16
MRFGTFVAEPSIWPITQESALVTRFPPATTLFQVALQWLREDKTYREGLEKQGFQKLRGARKNEVAVYIFSGSHQQS